MRSARNLSRLGLKLALVAMVSLTLMLSNSEKALAATGFFSGGYQSSANGHKLFDGGIYVNTADDLINFINSKLYTGSNGENLSAAYIVLTMLGYGNHNIQGAKDVFSDWSNLVESYGNYGLINFNATFSYTINTELITNRTDVVQYCQVSGAFPSCSGSDTINNNAIVFYNPSNPSIPVYALKKPCGNPVGGLSGLPPTAPPPTATATSTSPPPQPSLTCVGVQVMPMTLLANHQATLSYYYWNTGNTTINASQLNGSITSSSNPPGTMTPTPFFAQSSAPPYGGLFSNSVTFTVPDTAYFVITVNVTSGSVPVTNCGSTTVAVAKPVCAGVNFPANLEAGEPFTMTVLLGNNGAGYYSPPDVQLLVEVKNQSGSTIASAMPAPYGAVYGYGSGSYSMPMTINTPGFYPVYARLVDSAGRVLSYCNNGGYLPIIDVPTLPYMRTYNNDVSAGGSFSVGKSTDCAAASNGKIVTFTDSSPPYKGSSAELGVTALQLITEHAGGVGTTNGPTGLDLSNTANTAYTGRGGYFSTKHCVSDYYAVNQSEESYSAGGGNYTLAYLYTQSQQSGYVHKGQAVITGDLTIPAAGSLGLGQKLTIFATGNVTINGNLTLASGPYAAKTDIPNLTIISKGNIIVAGGVTRLDGIFIAQGSGGSAGDFNTCNGRFVGYTNLYSECNSPLVINGAVIANHITLVRSSGSKRYSSAADNTDITGNAAEVFNFTPSTYLSDPSYEPVGQEAVDYQSASTLPPIL